MVFDPNYENIKADEYYYDCPRCGLKMENEEKRRERVPKFCPLIKDNCKLSECMFFSSSGSCTFNRIATSLDVLREGVPVIPLFEQDKDEEIEDDTNNGMEEIIGRYVKKLLEEVDSDD